MLTEKQIEELHTLLADSRADIELLAKTQNRLPDPEAYMTINMCMDFVCYIIECTDPEHPHYFHQTVANLKERANLAKQITLGIKNVG
jgi:hypothetical protein